MIVMDIGEIKITKDGKEFYYATNGGFADIRPESVMLLVETAEKVSDIDKDRAEAAIKRAKDRLGNNETDLERANTAINRARNRIKISSRI